MTHRDGLPRFSARSVAAQAKWPIGQGLGRRRPTGRGGDPYGSLSPLLGISRCHTVIFRDGSGCDVLRLNRFLFRSGLAHRARMPSGVDEHHRCCIASTKVPSLQRGGGWVALSTISGSRNHGPTCPARDPSSCRAAACLLDLEQQICQRILIENEDATRRSRLVGKSFE